MTAIEIILGLALILLMGALVIGSIRVPEPGKGPRGSTQHIVLQIIHQAHVLAQTYHQEVELSFDAENQVMVLVALPSGKSWEMQLPEGEEPWEVEFRRLTPDTGLTGTPSYDYETLTSRSLRFHPWGGSHPSHIRLRRGMEDLDFWVEAFSAHLMDLRPA